MQIANLLPVFAILFDLAENIFASIVIVRYPRPSILAATAASIATPIKWISVGGSFLLFFGLLIALLIKRKTT